MTGPSKRLEEARKAFEHGDKQASARAHAHKAISQASEEHGGAESQYLGEISPPRASMNIIARSGSVRLGKCNTSPMASDPS